MRGLSPGNKLSAFAHKKLFLPLSGKTTNGLDLEVLSWISLLAPHLLAPQFHIVIDPWETSQLLEEMS